MIALIHIKKTAGKSLKHIMGCEMGIGHCDVKRWHRSDRYYSAADLKRLLRLYPWLQSIAGHSIRPYSDLRQGFPELRYYTFVRDPLKRCVSQYQYSVFKGRCPPDSFASWIEQPGFRNVQVQSLAGCEDLSAAIKMLDREVAFVGLMERFEESLTLMSAVLGCKHLRARQRVNAAPEQRIRDRVLGDPAAVRALRKANALDIQLYDYVTREIFPRQQNQVHARHQTHTYPALPKPDRRRVNGRLLINNMYRYAVYKPVVSAYRKLSAPSTTAL